MRRVDRAMYAAAAALAIALVVAGCAAPTGGADKLPPAKDAAFVSRGAAQAIAPGRSSKAEVLAALGPGARFRFDSGWEVWAWRLGPPRVKDDPESAPEFVVLFGPDGVVRKARLRPAPDARPGAVQR